MWHMEVPRLGAASELVAAGLHHSHSRAGSDCGCDLHHSSRQHWILNTPHSRPLDLPISYLSWYSIHARPPRGVLSPPPPPAFLATHSIQSSGQGSDLSRSCTAATRPDPSPTVLGQGSNLHPRASAMPAVLLHPRGNSDVLSFFMWL